MKIFPFTAFIPDITQVHYDEAFYQKIRDDVNQLIDQKYFIPSTDAPALYVLEISAGQNISTGLVTLTSIDDYKTNRIKKHEQTITKKELFHKKLMEDRRAMIKPAALIVEFNRQLYALLNSTKRKNKPLVDLWFPEKKIRHRLWAISDQQKISDIQTIFATALQTAVIADGHHRFATMAASTSTKDEKILSVYFDPDQMQVSTFYRIISFPKSNAFDMVMYQLKKIDPSIKKVRKVVSQKNTIHLIYNESIYRFKMTPSKGQLVCHRFANKITAGLFGIKQEYNNKRIKYEEYDDWTPLGIGTAFPDQFIFVLPSLRAKEVLESNKILPPKSTFFTPRIINGLAIAVLNN